MNYSSSLLQHLNLIFKPDEPIWLKLGTHTFLYGELDQNGSLTVYKTYGKGTERKIDRSQSYDVNWLLKQSEELEGGLLYSPGKPLEFPLKGYSNGSNDLGCELDWGTREKQQSQFNWFKAVSGLEPLILSSGGKSLHGHLILDIDISVDYRNYLLRLFCIALLGDPSCAQEYQAMRLAGGYRKEKGKLQELISPGRKHSLEEIIEGLEAAFKALGYIYPTSLSEERWGLLAKILRSSTSDATGKQDQLREILNKSEEDLFPKREYKERLPVIYTNLSSSLSVPLEYFLSKENQNNLRGVSDHRNNLGTALLRDLLACEQWLTSNGISYSGNAYDLFIQYCQRCPSGGGWDQREWESIWRSNSGKSFTPAITSEGMEKRLSWHRRQNDPDFQKAAKALYRKQNYIDSSIDDVYLDSSIDIDLDNCCNEDDYYLDINEIPDTSETEYQQQLANQNEPRISEILGLEDSVYDSFKNLSSLEKFNPTYIHIRHFPKDFSFPNSAKIICLKGKKKTGKTEAIAEQIGLAQAKGQPCFVVTHRIKLAQALCKRYGLNHLTDITQLKTLEGKLLGYGLCIDSLRPSSQARFNPSEFDNALVIIDEADEVLNHLFLSDTLAKNGERVEVLLSLQEGIKNCLSSEDGKVFLMSADLSPKEINFIKALGDNPEVFVLENTFKPIQGKRKALIYESEAHLMISLEKTIKRGEKTLVHLSSQKNKYKWSTATTEKKLEKKLKAEFPTLRLLRIDSETVADKNHPAYGCMNDLDALIAQYDIVLASPTIETGISIELEGHFDSVWIIANGTQSVNAGCQTPERLRADVDRHIFIKKTSNQRIGNGATYAQGLLDWKDKRTKFNDESFRDVAEAQARCSVGSLFSDYWAQIGAEYNIGMIHYEEIFLGKLGDEGYEIVHVETLAKAALSEETTYSKEVSGDLYREHCEAVSAISNPDNTLYELLEKQQDKTIEEKTKHEKGTICRFYLTENVTPEFVVEHEDGLYQKLDTLYSLFEGREFLEKRSEEKLEKLTHKGKCFEPDVIKALPKSKITILEKLLKPLIIPDIIYTQKNLSEWFNEQVLPIRNDVRDFLGLTIGINTKRDNTISTLRELLKLVGVPLTSLDKREGQVRQYQLKQQDLDKHKEIRERWLNRDCAKYRPETVTSSVQKVTIEPNNITAQLPLMSQITPVVTQDKQDDEVKEKPETVTSSVQKVTIEPNNITAQLPLMSQKLQALPKPPHKSSIKIEGKVFNTGDKIKYKYATENRIDDAIIWFIDKADRWICVRLQTGVIQVVKLFETQLLEGVIVR